MCVCGGGASNKTNEKTTKKKPTKIVENRGKTCLFILAGLVRTVEIIGVSQAFFKNNFEKWNT